MNFEFFIASRIFLKDKGNFSKPIVSLGVVSVALGLAAMIISVAIVTGFQNQIREKVIGFGSHIQITNFEVNSSWEASPVNKNQPFIKIIGGLENIKHIQSFANKAGIVKTEEQIEGVIFKGVDREFDWTYFRDNLIEGEIISFIDEKTSNNIIISKSLAKRIKLKVKDELRMYFIVKDEMQPRGRKFNITGIYETGLEEFDKMYILGDIGHIQKLNDWTKDQVGGFEILLNDFDKIDQTGEEVYKIIGYELSSKTIKQLHPQIFEWLSLQDMNVMVIIALMILVAGITMISTLLILILEKTNMIGILKALGTKNVAIRKIFIYNAAYIIGKGLIWGNIIAIGLCILQAQTGFLKLNQESYYVSEIPINLEIAHIFLINIGTLIICTLMILIPTYIITKIKPVRAIRFN